MAQFSLNPGMAQFSLNPGMAQSGLMPSLAQSGLMPSLAQSGTSDSWFDPELVLERYPIFKYPVSFRQMSALSS